MAFFVEGLTEQYFIEKLISEIIEKRKLTITKNTIRGGSKNPITITEIGSPVIGENTIYYILIYDCGSDTTVASYIREQRESLLNKGYSLICGILDVYPKFTRNEIPLLEKNLYYKIPATDIKIKFILSIMEVEAWFIAESNHFQKINKTLTNDFILNQKGFDPSVYNTELLDKPAEILNEIYHLVGFAYNKNIKTLARTIDNLDMNNLYLSVRERISSFNELLILLDNFFN